MSLKRRALLGVAITIFLTALIAFGPDRKFDESLRIGGGAVLLFWASHLHLWWRSRRDANAKAEASE